MQPESIRRRASIAFPYLSRPRDGEWRFFYRDFFTMFLRWTRPITLVDGTVSMDGRLMRRKVRGAWQYRALTAAELRYILDIENGTHC